MTGPAVSPQLPPPAEAFAGDVPLVADLRGDYVSSLHRGAAAVSDTSGRLLFAVGHPGEAVFLRSAAKPFQVMPAVLSGAIDRFGISPRELAVLCASHSGQPYHLEAVLSVLNKLGLHEDALHCGIHPPSDESSAAERWREHREPTPVCNNCSGAHTGMLAACLQRGWPIERYEDPAHPLQQEIRRILAQFAGLPEVGVTEATDNCAVPTFRLPLGHAGQAFARLASGEGVPDALSGAASRVVSVMTAYPEMVGGDGRFDTDLMRAGGGAIVAKGGAEGFQGVGLRRRGLGIAMKISDGASKPLGPAVVSILRHLGALDADAERTLAVHADAPVRNLQNAVVGRMVPVFSLGATS